MAESDKNEIYLSSSPHFHSPLSVKRLMYSVVIALLPICVEGILLYGIRVLGLILTSVATCMSGEYVYRKLLKKKRKNTALDGSAIITGILLALVMPPTVPFWVIILGDLFAIIVVKNIFGGLGQNVWNPALGGRAFLMISFPAIMGSAWINPKTDAVSSATILSQIKSSADAVTQATSHASNIPEPTGFLDTFLNGHFAGIFEYKDLYLDYLLGNRAGCIGESSALLIIITGIVLILLRVIDWRIPFSFIGTVVLCTFISGGDIVMCVLSGGLLLGAFFMATDYVTSPMTRPGMLIFGAGCGLVTFLIRTFGGYPEGVMFSILFMNCFYPFLNNIIPRKYGYGKIGK